jgi:putative transposase
MCEALDLHRSTYYHWRAGIENRKEEVKASKELGQQIEAIFLESRKSYGAVRVHDQLKKKGISAKLKQVRRIMKQKQLFSVHCRRKRKVITTDSTGNTRIASNILNRNFTATVPNEKWVGDISYIPTAEGWLYLATVLDLFSRKIVGYATSKNIHAALACKAFTMAVMRRQQPKQLLYHSDRGSVYGSNAFSTILTRNNITPSMSRKANCYDNAVAESFFHTIKVELISQNRYLSRISAAQSIAEWIENFYNPNRTHSSLGYCSPIDFEAKHSDSI